MPTIANHDINKGNNLFLPDIGAIAINLFSSMHYSCSIIVMRRLSCLHFV